MELSEELMCFLKTTGINEKSLEKLVGRSFTFIGKEEEKMYFFAGIITGIQIQSVIRYGGLAAYSVNLYTNIPVVPYFYQLGGPAVLNAPTPNEWFVFGDEDGSFRGGGKLSISDFPSVHCAGS